MEWIFLSSFAIFNKKMEICMTFLKNLMNMYLILIFEWSFINQEMEKFVYFSTNTSFLTMFWWIFVHHGLYNCLLFQLIQVLQFSISVINAKLKSNSFKYQQMSCKIQLENFNKKIWKIFSNKANLQRKFLERYPSLNSE